MRVTIPDMFHVSKPQHVLRSTAFPLAAFILLSSTGCKVRVDKSGDGDGGNVKIATPFGSIAVNKGQATASDVGLPAYPGSTLRKDDNGDNSAKVDLGFGSWRLKVRVASYATADSREQVVDFYRKALNQYGGVITCAGNKPVGTPERTGEGLTCSDDDRDRTQHASNSDDLELKAGSKHHQHIVALKAQNAAETRFTLIALDLPHGDNEHQETN
jgi:hypothetical protein